MNAGCANFDVWFDYARFDSAAAVTPFGSNVVERSTPERSTPLRSVSRKIATPRSAPLNFAPAMLARRKFTLRSFARSKFTLERSQRKNSMPLASASLRSAPGKIDSVISQLRRSALCRLAPERSATASLDLRKSEPERFASRRIAPLKLRPLRSAFDRSAPVRSARAPPSLPLKKSSCALRMSSSDLPPCLMLFALRKPMWLWPFLVFLYSSGLSGWAESGAALSLPCFHRLPSAPTKISHRDTGEVVPWKLRLPADESQV